MNQSSAWGDDKTQHFYDLLPDDVLDATEALGFETTGRCLTLNSLENRVFEVETWLDYEPDNPSEFFKILKFYRPGRWTEAQIQEEHDFLLDLAAAELPVIAPEQDEEGNTLHLDDATGILYAIFPKQGGRMPDELDDSLASRLGAIMAQIHNVGARYDFEHRLQLTPEIFGMQNMEWLLDNGSVPQYLEQDYETLVTEICNRSQVRFDSAHKLRLHGDAHLGNVLLHPDHGIRLVDLDDSSFGPAVQDIWLLTPGDDDYAKRARDKMLEGYDQFRPFPWETLNLVEPLRALRYIHFSSWIARRWQDQTFQNAFPQFGTDRYWEEQVQDLREQLSKI